MEGGVGFVGGVCVWQWVFDTMRGAVTMGQVAQCHNKTCIHTYRPHIVGFIPHTHAPPPYTQAEKDAADKLAETARTQLEQISTALRDELEEQQQLHTVTLERLKAEHGKVEVALHEEAALLREQLQQATCAAEEARGQVAELQVELGSVKEAHEALQGQAGETEGQLSTWRGGIGVLACGDGGGLGVGL